MSAEDRLPDDGRAVWTDADLKTMGWHDATVYAFSFVPSGNYFMRLAVDLDYIFRWVHPEPPERAFKFWVSPVTLSFDQVWGLRGDIDMTYSREMQLDEVTREAVDDGRPGEQWNLVGQTFELSFRSSGYRQVSRQKPILTHHQAIDLAERGGLSFDETPYAAA